ncbi:hypothetical protein D3C85_1832000 [compost metagenome]
MVHEFRKVLQVAPESIYFTYGFANSNACSDIHIGAFIIFQVVNGTVNRAVAAYSTGQHCTS